MSMKMPDSTGPSNPAPTGKLESVKVKYGGDPFAVLVRFCEVSAAVDTLVFPGVDVAKKYCEVKWGIAFDKWEANLVTEDPSSSLKLNGMPVSYVGWQVDLDEYEKLSIHLERIVVEFGGDEPALAVDGE